MERYGKITRRETAELCRLGSQQAKRLLNSLVQKGQLVRRGQGKGSFYEQSPKIWSRPKICVVTKKEDTQSHGTE